MMEYSVYSVISPEGCASILWRDTAKAEVAAEMMKITAPDLKKFGSSTGSSRSRWAARTATQGGGRRVEGGAAGDAPAAPVPVDPPAPRAALPEVPGDRGGEAEVRGSGLTQDRLKELRVEIDAIDDRILELLNARAKAAIEVGSIKKERNLKFYVPEREVEILRRLTAVNGGPFPNEGLKAIYREIISASLSSKSLSPWRSWARRPPSPTSRA